MTTLARLTALSALLFGSLIGASIAAASPENDFCRSMAGAGFSGDCATLTTLARDVCVQLDGGIDVTAVAEKLDLATKDQNVSNFIVAGARLYFCPEPDQI
jgi:alpha/beta superfamily hydrolase